MSDHRVDTRHGATPGATRLLASAAALPGRAPGREMAALRTVLRNDAGWLDDRRRWAVGVALRGTIIGVENEIRAVAEALLLGQGEESIAERIRSLHSIADRVIADDSEPNRRVAAEVVAVTRLRLLGDAIPPRAPDRPDQPSLLARLVEHDDAAVVTAARALLRADARAPHEDAATAILLPEAVRIPLVWRVAAAIRLAIRSSDRAEAALLDHALCDAARRQIDDHRGGIGAEEAAMRLSAALDAGSDALPGLLDDALADCRITLFAALLAWALQTEFSAIRELVFDDVDNGLWVAMRAADLPRDMIARAAFLLSEAGSRHDIELFADALDTLMAITPEEARAALTHLALDPEYRHAVRALAPKWLGW